MLVTPSNFGRLDADFITTTVTADASANTKGAYSSIISTTAQPIYGLWLLLRNVGTAANVRGVLLDIAIGDSGGGNEEVILPNLNAGAAVTGVTGNGKEFYFPVNIPAGVSVRGRCQASLGGDTVEVFTWAAHTPLYPHIRGKVQDYGSDTSASRGTSVTPANSSSSGTLGTWTQLTASTTYAHTLWACSMDQLADTTIASTDYSIQLGIGPDSSNVTTIFSGLFITEANENINNPFPLISYAPVPAGTPLWARLRCSGDTEARGVIAYGVE